MTKEYRNTDIDALQELVSEEFGDWGEALEISQQMIDTFADITHDHQWIHVDTERAQQESPFGGTIAHGFLTLALVPKLKPVDDYTIVDYKHALNYGSNKLRFVAPVKVGSQVHARSRLKEVSATRKGATQYVTEVEVAVVGSERPCLIYEFIIQRI